MTSVGNIFPVDDVPEPWRHYVEVNRAMAATCPPIVDRKPPLAKEDANP